jgi:hypothetical protein
MKRFLITATAALVLVTGALVFVAVSPTGSASAQTATEAPGPFHPEGVDPGAFQPEDRPRSGGIGQGSHEKGPHGLFESELLAGIDPVELREAIDNGTVSDLVDLEALAAERLADATARLDELVADGILTEAEAAARLAEIEVHLAAVAAGDFEFGSMGQQGHGQGFGQGERPHFGAGEGPGSDGRGPGMGGAGIHTPGTGLDT